MIGEPDYTVRFKGTVKTIKPPSPMLTPGQEVFRDDFRYIPLASRWPIISNAARVTDFAFIYGTCVKFTPPIGSLAYIQRYLGIPNTVKLGFIFRVCIRENTERFQLSVLESYATKQYEYRIVYDAVNKKWLYLNENGDVTDIPDGAQELDMTRNIWNHVKFVIRFDTHQYVRLLCNEKVFNLTGLLPTPSIGKEIPHLWLEFAVYATSAGAALAYLDEFAITGE